jgi:hypothetical protein
MFCSKMTEIVYVLSNPAMPSLTRIGTLNGDGPSGLMDEIYTENLPLPYECVYACTANDAAAAERAIREKFAAQKIGPHGEFFEIESGRVVEALRFYGLEDVTADFRAGFDSALTDGEKDARADFCSKTVRLNDRV